MLYFVLREQREEYGNMTHRSISLYGKLVFFAYAFLGDQFSTEGWAFIGFVEVAILCFFMPKLRKQSETWAKNI